MTRDAAADEGRRAGFALVEVLAALLVLGLALAVGTTALARRSAAPLPHDVAQSLSSAMIAARAAALRTGTERAVAFDLAGRQVTAGTTSIEIPDGMTIRVSVAGSPSNAGTARIVFRPDGSASGAVVDLAEGARSASVGVDWLTGLPRVRGTP